MSPTRCEKFPSLDRRYCAHCQGPQPKERQLAEFSLKEVVDRYPMVEILKNGGPIHWNDSHFQFGTSKAELMLACLPALKKFGWCSDEERFAFQPEIFMDSESGLRVRAFVEMYPDFERSTGETIDRPWLLLQALTNGQRLRKGLGITKCKAVWSVRDDLRAWWKRNHYK